MFPQPDFRWECTNPDCLHRELDYLETHDGSKQCPECGSEMYGNPMKKGGPEPIEKFKKY